MAEDNKKRLELDLERKRKKLSDLTKQISVKNSQINSYGKQASLPSASSDNEQFAEKEKTKSKQAASYQQATVRIQLQDLLKQIDDTKDIIKDLESQINSPKSETNENVKKYKMAKISKRQIIEMLQSAEPARMTKSQLIESITNSILNEGINDDIKRKLESGENDYYKYLSNLDFTHN
jgi:chromosome segregation ATPase